MDVVNIDAASAETLMSVGVQLRTYILDENYQETGLARTGGTLEAQATNRGIISFQVKMSTRVIGTAVTDKRHCGDWAVMLMLPASSGAKTGDQAGTKLQIVEPGRRVAFRTTGLVRHVSAPVPWEDSTEYYQSAPLDVFATTSESDAAGNLKNVSLSRRPLRG